MVGAVHCIGDGPSSGPLLARMHLLCRPTGRRCCRRVARVCRGGSGPELAAPGRVLHCATPRRRSS